MRQIKKRLKMNDIMVYYSLDDILLKTLEYKN
jgi:hypothetical protein